MHTVHKMNTLFNNQSYIDETRNVFLGWEAIQGNEPLSVYHEMTFSFKIMEVIDALTNPIINAHMKKMFINGLLNEAGFKEVKTFTDFDFNQKEEDADRLFFVVKIDYEINRSKITRSYVIKCEGVIFV